MAHLHYKVYRRLMIEGVKLQYKSPVSSSTCVSKNNNSSCRLSSDLTLKVDVEIKNNSFQLKTLHNRKLNYQERTENSDFIKQKYCNTSDYFGSSTKSSKSKMHPHKYVNEYNPKNVECSKDKFNMKSCRKSSTQASYKDRGTDVSSEEFTYEIKDYPAVHNDEKWKNTFGTLETEDQNETDVEDSISSDDVGQERKHIRLSKYNRRNVPFWYGQMIEKFGKQGKIKEAIAVLDDWMLSEDRVKPNNYNFSVLIGVLGRAGYTRKAFQVYNKMKKMGLEPDAVTYTGLFNACANSPWKEDGLQRTRQLHLVMKEKNWLPNLITSRVMIKAYGVCGDLPAAFGVMDDIANRYQLDQRCFSSLMMGCIMDKENGMKLTAEVWQLMHQYGVKPDLYLYNLLLRTIRDCRISAVDADSLTHYYYKRLEADQHIESCVQTTDIDRNVDSNSMNCSPSSETLGTETCLSKAHFEAKAFNESDTSFCNTEKEISIKHYSCITPENNSDSCLVYSNNSEDKWNSSEVDFNQRENRMALIGGTETFLKQLKNNGIKPNIKTFALLLDNCIQTKEAEDSLLMNMETYSMKPDQEFYNSLIRKRCLRGNFDDAMLIFQKMGKDHISPNMETFKYLAISCKKPGDGLQLLNDIEDSGSQPTIEIFASLIRVSGINLYYKTELIKQMNLLKMQPTKQLLDIIEDDISNITRLLVQMERDNSKEKKKLEKYQKDFSYFMANYTAWLKRFQVFTPEHPWTAFLKAK